MVLIKLTLRLIRTDFVTAHVWQEWYEFMLLYQLVNTIY